MPSFPSLMPSVGAATSRQYIRAQAQIELRQGPPAHNNTIQSAIKTAAAQTDVDFHYLLAQAKIESALDSNARATTSSASGLYQFIDQTWLDTVQKHGRDHGYGWAAAQIKTINGRASITDPAMRDQVMALRFDPQAAALMAGEFARDNNQYLTAKFNRAPDHTELYLAHFLGAAGAARFIRNHQENPDMSAASLFPQAAKANHNIFFDRHGPRSLDEVRTLFSDKLETAKQIEAAPVRQNAPAMDLRPFSADHMARLSTAETVQATRQRTSMADILRDTFGAQSGTGNGQAAHINKAYAQLQRLGL